MDSEINSKSYWDNRFESDWAEASGREQTTFFCELAVRHMPMWLKRAIREENLTVCDWGCAEGDGTRILAEALAPAQVVGVDFSNAAIRKASEHYPGVEFRAADYLDDHAAPDDKFDVVFTSNTLEHFDDPFGVLQKLTPRIGQWLVMLVPYREYERISEHEFTFEFSNTPLQLLDGMVLAHAELMDVSEHQPCYWPGEQMLLVYGRPEALSRQKLTLAESVLTCATVHRQHDGDVGLQRELRSDAEAVSARLDAVTSQLKNVLAERDTLRQARIQLDAEWAATQRQLSKTDELRRNAVTLLEQRDQDIAMIYASLSWRVTKPLRYFWSPIVKSRRAMGRARRFVARQGGVMNTARKLVDMYRRDGAAGVKAALRRKIGAPLVSADRPYNQEVPVPPPVAPGAGEDVIFWGVIDWHFRFQRPQQLALGFAARGHRVFYVSAQLVDEPTPGFTIEPIGGQSLVYQVRFHARGAQPIYNQLPPEDIRKQIQSGVGAFVRWADAERYITLVQHPFWLDSARSIPRSRMVYDCMDHHEGFGNVAPDILEAEKGLISQSDVLVVTSDWLRDACHGKSRNIFTIRNACDFTHFNTRPAEHYKDRNGRQIIGYYGAIAEWFDVELVRKVALAFPDALVLLIGADTCDVRGKLADVGNVEFLGEVPYTKLPYYLYAFDVCLLPFRVIDLTLATNPVKVYEYLCSGKPVVSVDLPEMRQFGELVRTAADGDAFVEQCRQALAAPDAPELVERRIAFASNQTWRHRALELEESLAQVEQPLVSIVVLTYNNLELTRKCLASIDRCTQDVRYEIVIVDNASTDGSPEYLRSFAAGRDDVKLLLNTDNKGFAAGNNQGLAMASGEYLVILNNDTVVSPGWASGFIRHLRADPSIGLIGPVTNNIGNEAKIQIDYPSTDDMPAVARKYTVAHLGMSFDIRTAAFFCVMIPRPVYEAVGGLDEAFGLGFFEDDDYCRRVEQNGNRCVCAEDVFVHHHLSASFSKLGAERRNALMEKNRAIYEAKWGPWSPHRYRD
ncbi:glycosyltransferase [Cupriavidus sp.]|uniref:glycosyltransferase n=1 Tax=Cupriavidus sp. TaxID=1873897 RepID=UPI0031D899E3